MCLSRKQSSIRQIGNILRYSHPTIVPSSTVRERERHVLYQIQLYVIFLIRDINKENNRKIKQYINLIIDYI